MSQIAESMIIRFTSHFRLMTLGLTCSLTLPLCGCHPLGQRLKNGLGSVEQAEDDWAPPKVNTYSQPTTFPRRYQPTPAQNQQANHGEKNTTGGDSNQVVTASGEGPRQNNDRSRNSVQRAEHSSLLQQNASARNNPNLASTNLSTRETSTQDVDLEDAMSALPPNMRNLLQRQLDAIAQRNQLEQEAALAQTKPMERQIANHEYRDDSDLLDEREVTTSTLPIHSEKTPNKNHRKQPAHPTVAEAKQVPVSRSLSDAFAEDETIETSQRNRSANHLVAQDSSINSASYQQPRNSSDRASFDLSQIPIETAPHPNLIQTTDTNNSEAEISSVPQHRSSKEQVRTKLSDSVVEPAQEPTFKSTKVIRSSLSDRDVNEVQTASASVSNNPNEPSPVVTASLHSNQPSIETPWNHSVKEAIEKLEKQLSDSSVKDENVRINQEVTLRMLYLADRQLDSALKPIDGLDDHERDYFKHELLALYEATNPDAVPVKSMRWSTVMNNQRQATNHLASVSKLEVKSVSFCTDVQGYGVVTKFPNYQFKPDQDILLYCELENVSAEPVKEGFETQLQGTYEIIDPSGRRIADQLLPMEKEVCKNHRRDYFIVYRIFTPMQIAPGNYQLRLTVEDMKGKKFGQSQIDFQIQR